MNKFFKFFTSAVFFALLIGILLIIVGHTNSLTYLLPNFITDTSPIHTIVKTIGAAFVGSGVFTAIIRSSEYSEIFSNVIGEIIWSKKYIEKRKDKKEIWSMISRLTYDEKFPLISAEIEDIITNHYFPVAHNFYLENFDFCVNITDLNENFWKQEETLNVVINPINSKEPIEYKFTSGIDLPDNPDIEDITAYNLISVAINGKSKELEPPETKKEAKYLKHTYSIKLQHEEHYDLFIKREKIVFKKTNPDKRTFAPYIIKDAKISVITNTAMHVDFHKMGTIGEFKRAEDQINMDVKIRTWHYKGLILPQQGFIIIFK